MDTKELSIIVPLLSEIPGFVQGNRVIITQKETELSIVPLRMNHDPIMLRYNQVISSNVENETFTVEKDKSTVGRGLLGTALLGPAGAVIGVASAKGKKEKKKHKTVFVIKYIPSSGEGISELKFDSSSCIPAFKFSKELNSKATGKSDNPTSNYL